MLSKMFTGTAILCVILGAQVSANASVFDFSYSGLQFGTTMPETVTGTLTTNSAIPNSVSSQTIISITGTDNGKTITGLVPPNGYLGNDNLLMYPASSGSYIDHSGFSFSINGIYANIFTDFGSTYVYEDTTGLLSLAGTFTLKPENSPVPEPGSFALLGTGLLGLGFVLRRRHKIG